MSLKLSKFLNKNKFDSAIFYTDMNYWVLASHYFYDIPNSSSWW